MKTFAKVIGASFAMVVLLFAVVAAALHWEDAEGISPVLETPVVDQAPMMPEPVPELSPPPVERTRPQVESRPTPAPLHIEPNAPLTPALAATAGAEKSKDKEAEKMSTDEYVAREMHYIGKIQKDAEAVLARAAADRDKKAELQAELDALEYQ